MGVTGSEGLKPRGEGLVTRLMAEGRAHVWPVHIKAGCRRPFSTPLTPNLPAPSVSPPEAVGVKA